MCNVTEHFGRTAAFMTRDPSGAPATNPVVFLVLFCFHSNEPPSIASFALCLRWFFRERLMP